MEAEGPLLSSPVAAPCPRPLRRAAVRLSLPAGGAAVSVPSACAVALFRVLRLSGWALCCRAPAPRFVSGGGLTPGRAGPSLLPRPQGLRHHTSYELRAESPGCRGPSTGWGVCRCSETLAHSVRPSACTHLPLVTPQAVCAWTCARMRLWLSNGAVRLCSGRD